jgi:hypothetical protein
MNKELHILTLTSLSGHGFKQETQISLLQGQFQQLKQMARGAG